MTTQPTESEKTRMLAQILQSPGFQDSKRHQELLQYLVKRSSASGSEPVKETEIAQEVFGKDSKFDPATDPLIRSYVSNLRKKLEHYYLTTSDACTHRIEIPKGHYVIRYTAVGPRDSSPNPQPRARRLYLAAIIVLLAAVIVLGYRELRHSADGSAQTSTAANPLWNEFTAPDSRPTLIVLGDFFFMRERNRNDAYYRNIRINTLEEYLEYISANPEFGKRYTINNFTYLRPSAPWGIMQILPILQRARKGVNLKLASQFTSDDFKTNNVVFIGSFKTLHLLNKLLTTFGIEHFSAPSSFRVRDTQSDSQYVFKPEKLSAGDLESDYGVVAKGRGPDGSAIIMMLGFSESGVIQAAHAACDPALLETIAGLYPSSAATIDPAQFTLVIGAEGITQSLYSADIKYVSGLGMPPSATRKDTVKLR